MNRTVPQRLENVETHEVDESGEVVVHEPLSGQVMALNAIGAAALLLADGQRDVAAIVTEIARNFEEIPLETIEADVRLFFDDLQRRGIVNLRTVP